MISLLWNDAPPRGTPPTTIWEDDLGVQAVAKAISPQHAGFVRSVLVGLCAEPTTIRHRQDVLADLAAMPSLVVALTALHPQIASLAYRSSSRWESAEGVFQVTERLAELETYVEVVRQLLVVLDAAGSHLTAAGWVRLREEMHAIAQADEFQTLAGELPTLRAQIEQARSVTVGVNLNEQLRPESATLLGFAAERFTGPRSLLGRLFGTSGDTRSGVVPLRQADERQVFGPDRQFFRDLNQLLEEVTQPVAKALARYTGVHAGALTHLENEFVFYLGAVRLHAELQAAGYVLCQPVIAPPGARVCEIDAAYSVGLALNLRTHRGEGVATIVPSDVRFNNDGRIFILTGPNRGGKTTFTRAVGMAQVLAQAGLHVPGQTARISPVDKIETVFPAAEQAQAGMGRLDEEAAQLAQIFRHATSHSLVLLNEPLGSTSPAEALSIARDVVGGLRLLGCRAVLVTHLHDLANEVDALNTAVTGSSMVANLVAAVATDDAEHGERTYRIVPGTPLGRSYAADVAVQHGLQLHQIEQTLAARGIGERAPRTKNQEPRTENQA